MSDLVSLSKLFDRRIYRIPDYQRGYAWTESQLKDFWDDINNLTENRYHYTGMLSLKLLKKEELTNWNDEKWIIDDKDYEPYHVVDGQQRLTTFIILINSIINFAVENNIEYINGDDIEDIKSRYIVEYKKPEKISKAYKFGYEIDNPSFLYLKDKIFGDEKAKSIEESFYTLNLERAKKYFDEKISNLFKEKSIDGVESLFRKLTNRLTFNIYYIDEEFDVYLAFETMNNRGKKLSNLEILKNRLIYLTTIYNDNVLSIDDKEQLRRDINEAWKVIYFELGRNKDKPLNDDEYLRNHWSMFFKYKRTTGDDYIDYLFNEHFTVQKVFACNNEVENENLKPIQISDYVTSLKNVAEYWYYSFNPEESKEFTKDEKEWLLKLNRIGINYYRTLVVASFMNKKVTTEQRIALFKIIEKFIFVFFRMAKFQSSYQSTVSYNFASELMKGEINIQEIINTLHSNFEDNKDVAVETFISKVKGYFKNYDGYYSWSDLKYFLFEYEKSLSDGTYVSKLNDWDSFTKNEKDKISIEHIFPQTPKRFYWRNKFRDYSDEEKHCLANSLGNLLALSQSVNSALQNQEFNEKKKEKNSRRGYSNGSYSEMEVAKYSEWTPQEIKERGLKLISFMEKRWDISFKDDIKLEVLGLDFMKQERIESPELKANDMSVFQTEHNEKELRELISLFMQDILVQKENDGLINIINMTNAYLEFSCSKISEKVGLIGNGEWDGNKELIAFEIQNYLDSNAKIKLYLGPTDDNEIRCKWLNFAKNTKELGLKNKKMNEKWDALMYDYALAKTKDQYSSDEEYAREVINNLNIFF